MRLSVLCWFFADAAGLRRHQSFARLTLTRAGHCSRVVSAFLLVAPGVQFRSWSCKWPCVQFVELQIDSSHAQWLCLRPATRPRLAPASTVVVWGEWFLSPVVQHAVEATYPAALLLCRAARSLDDEVG